MMVFLPLTTSLVSKKSAVLRQTSGSCGKSAIVIVFIKEESKRLAMRNFEPRASPKTICWEGGNGSKNQRHVYWKLYWKLYDSIYCT